MNDTAVVAALVARPVRFLLQHEQGRLRTIAVQRVGCGKTDQATADDGEVVDWTHGPMIRGIRALGKTE